MTAPAESAPRRSTFHHGNLREAAILDGLAIVREFGPHGLKLELLSRRLGVTSASLYRHFRNFEHVRVEVAVAGRIEMARAIAAAIDALPPADTPERALARYLASGDAVIAFARTEPNLYLFMYAPFDATPTTTVPDDLNQRVPACLDDLERHGLLDPARRMELRHVALAGVHGAGSLIAQGWTPADQIDAMWAHVQASIVRTLDACRPPR